MGFLAKRLAGRGRPCAGAFLVALACNPALAAACANMGRSGKTDSGLGSSGCQGPARPSAASQRIGQHLELDALCADIAGTLTVNEGPSFTALCP